jgi:RNA polymerase sigma-70 factor (ECF subfamily)
MTDELLVIRCQLGEREAFAELVRARHTMVSTYVRRMLGPAEVDDVTQEVWFAVLRGLPRLRQPERFTPWLLTIARRAVANRLRAEYARPELLGSDAEQPAADQTEWVADRAAVAAGLAGLPAREREILILFYLQDLSVDTCAEICEVPVGTVKSRLSRARRLLRAELTEKGFQQ